MKVSRLVNFVTMMSVVLPVLLAISPTTAQTHSETRSCDLVHKMNEELHCGLVPRSDSMACTAASVTDVSEDFVVNSSFGPTSCKTSTALKDAMKEHRDDCSLWLDTRKKELGPKYMTGTCTEDCSDCPMGMKKCLVKGIVHYRK